MEGKRLILADGTVIENGEAGYSEGFLWLYAESMSMMQAAQIFLDSDKTLRIRFQYGEMEDVYDGFTVCRGITMNADGDLAVCMVKG